MPAVFRIEVVVFRVAVVVEVIVSFIALFTNFEVLPMMPMRGEDEEEGWVCVLCPSPMCPSLPSCPSITSSKLCPE